MSIVYDMFKRVSTKNSVTAANNDSGLEATLRVWGRSNVNIYYSVSGAATITVEVSNDGSNYYTLDTISTSGAQSEVLQYPFMAWEYVRVRTSTTGIDVTFEITASR